MKRVFFGWWMSLLLFSGTVSGQVIDSAVDFLLTENDSVNRNVLKMDGFAIDIREPVMLHRSGVPLLSGFGAMYLYVVRSDSVFIDGYRLEGSEGAPVYLAVVSDLERITLDPERIYGQVTIIKGMIDKCDSLLDFYDKQLIISTRKADSLYQKLPKNRTLKSKEWKTWDTVITIHRTNLYFKELYTEFKKYKKTPSLRAEFPEFFLSELFNRRTLKYSTVSVPGGLPKIRFNEDELAYQKAGRKNKDKYDRPIKKRNLKRERQAEIPVSDEPETPPSEQDSDNRTPVDTPQPTEEPVNEKELKKKPAASDEHQPEPESPNEPGGN